MLKLSYSRKTYYLAVQDEQAIAAIKERYGLSTDSDCVRFALRLVAESQMQLGAKKKAR